MQRPRDGVTDRLSNMLRHQVFELLHRTGTNVAECTLCHWGLPLVLRWRWLLRWHVIL